MSVDFTNLNKACPRDSYPSPRIDQLVDPIASHKLLSFMDVFSGYNQIRMDEADQEKTSFVTSQGLFYYEVMPFGMRHYIRTLLQEGKTFRHFHTNWNSKNTDFTIGGSLAGFLWSPLILCLSFQDIPSNTEIINA